MAQYDVNSTSGAGKPCRVFDADNVEIEEVVWCDTETGEVEVLCYENGDYVFTDDGKSVKREKRFHPKPLRIAWDTNVAICKEVVNTASEDISASKPKD